MKGSIYLTFKSIHRERRRLEDLVDRHGLQSELVLKKSRAIEKLITVLFDREHTAARLARNIITVFSKDPKAIVKTTPMGLRELFMRNVHAGNNLQLSGNVYELQKKKLNDGRYRLSLKFLKPVLPGDEDWIQLRKTSVKPATEKCVGISTCGHCDNTCPAYRG